MKAMGIARNRSWKFAAGLAFLCSSYGSIATARAQAPYLLPYTISTVAGGGTAPAVGANCPGSNGTTTKAEDALGDGCLASSSSVVTNTNIHDVGVDPVGNIYFLDTGSKPCCGGSTRAPESLTSPQAATLQAPSAPPQRSTLSVTAVPPQTQRRCRRRIHLPAIGLARHHGRQERRRVHRRLQQLSRTQGQRLHRMMTLVAGFVSGGTLTAPNKNKGTKGYTGDGGSAHRGRAQQRSRRCSGCSRQHLHCRLLQQRRAHGDRLYRTSRPSSASIPAAIPMPQRDSAGDGGPATAASALWSGRPRDRQQRQSLSSPTSAIAESASSITAVPRSQSSSR